MNVILTLNRTGPQMKGGGFPLQQYLCDLDKNYILILNRQ